MEMFHKTRPSTKLLFFLFCIILLSGLYLHSGSSTYEPSSETESINDTENTKQTEKNIGTVTSQLFSDKRMLTYTEPASSTTTVDEGNSTSESYIFKRVKEITKCKDVPREHYTMQWGPYWVLGKHVVAKRTYKCEESVTFATVATYNFLGNVLPIVESWDGPVSVAVYAPGSDFNLALESIVYLRECGNPVISEIVSFHLFFEMNYFPDEILTYENFLSRKGVNCLETPPYDTYTSGQSFKDQKNAFFMVNVARNIARKMSETHFIFSADIEMYPSTNISFRFLKMISNEDPETYSKQSVVYAIHAFEVNEGEKPPLNKNDLREMLKKNTAAPFHFKLCGRCHNFPHYEEWLKFDGQEIEITEQVTRTKTLAEWEPFFIGTNQDPWYDERVSWEGMRDKRIQAYALCLLGYNFAIPSDGFLVHKPGHKQTEYFGNRLKISLNMANTIDREFVPQYKKFYGDNSACKV